MRIGPMNQVSTEREAWYPRTREERATILRELHEILASRHFCNSKRYPALLRFLVENTLDGRADLLKERTLGIEVFDRPPTFDTNSDTVVRYTAGEVRKRLQLYYTEEGRNAEIRISLPIGTYIPEFLHGHDHGLNLEAETGLAENHAVPAEGMAGIEVPADEAPGRHIAPPLAPHEPARLTTQPPRRSRRLRWLIAGVIAFALLLLVAGVVWSRRAATDAADRQSALDSFWNPVLRDQHYALLCTGGVVFDRNKFSGVITASRDVDYPFVSLQNASAISEVSGVLGHFGAKTRLVFASAEPLTSLRENPVILLGGYNNDWTIRLLQPLRFHFTGEPAESIVDQIHPQFSWQRDRSQGYSSADDYALLARFRDATTDSWVVAMAGLGRNGTEAAAQFAVSPHYLEMLRRQTGQDFGSRNLEVLLRIKVIDGKTGAPSIIAVHTW